MLNLGFHYCLPISIVLMADFFIEDLVKTIIDKTLPNIPAMPMVTRTGPYITSLKSSAPNLISSEIILHTRYYSPGMVLCMNCVICVYNYLLLLGLQK